MYNMDNSRKVSQHSSPSNHDRRKKIVSSRSNLVRRSSRLKMATNSNHRESECDLASLAVTENDGGSTYSSDDSFESETAVNRRRNQRKENEIRRTNDQPAKLCEVGKYMAGREMTPFQERINALTAFPIIYYCLMFLLSGSWQSKSFTEAYDHQTSSGAEFDDSQCFTSNWLPHVHALPPLPPLAAAIGVLVHAPFSIIYHWNYAHRLPSGLARTNHWSRRMDQAMIHCQSAFFSYATTGRLDFFLMNIMLNMDCSYRLFVEEIRPRRNQIRIGISIAAYILPLLTRGEIMAFFQLCFLFAISGWLFCKYPLGGWSHTVFHIVLNFIPPIIISTALDLLTSQRQLEVAAHCAILARSTSS